MDLNQFLITGPSVSEDVVGTAKYGDLVSANGVAVTLVSKCLTDTFSVSNPGGGSPPVICGQNSGEHSKENTFNH